MKTHGALEKARNARARAQPNKRANETFRHYSLSNLVQSNAKYCVAFFHVSTISRLCLTRKVFVFQWTRLKQINGSPVPATTAALIVRPISITRSLARAILAQASTVGYSWSWEWASEEETDTNREKREKERERYRVSERGRYRVREKERKPRLEVEWASFVWCLCCIGVLEQTTMTHIDS